MEKKKINNPIKDSDLPNYLGIEKFNYGEVEEQDRIGVVTGLAWTEVGGEILKIETVVMLVKEKWKLQEN